MKNNKMNIYRLLIFLILAFAPLWILVLCTNSALGMRLYESTNAKIIYMIGVFVELLLLWLVFMNLIAKRDAVLYPEMQFCNLTTKYL